MRNQKGHEYRVLFCVPVSLLTGVERVHCLLTLIIRSDLAWLTDWIPIYKHSGRAGHSHLLALVEIGLDIGFILICVEATVEGSHVQPDAFRHGLQAAVAQIALVFA